MTCVSGTPRRASSFASFLPHNSAVRDAEFSPDGRWLVTAAAKATLWNARTGAIVLRLTAGDGVVTSAGFDPSGREIVTGDADGTVGRYACQICAGLDDLVALARIRLAATGRELTDRERSQYVP